MRNLYVGRLLKLGVVAALALGVVAAGLFTYQPALAQEPQHQTFMVMAGGHFGGNMEALTFAPQSIQVHRGDTIMWHFASFHNVHFASAPAELITVTDVNGQPTPQINPVVAFPTIQNGADYQGGDANSGIPVGENAFLTFSLVIDLPPGTYSYVCDIHPGMIGTIIVVEDDVEIPSPAEVAEQGQTELSQMFQAAAAAGEQLLAGASTAVENSTFNVTVGSGDTGRVTINQFTSPVAVIQAGQSVTWTNPANGIEPHSVTSTAFQGEEFIPLMQDGAPPVIAVGPALLGNTQSGAEVAQGDVFNSGLFNPGQSFTLIFKDPGVYPYICVIHPGMNGVVVVEPAA